MQAQAVVSFGGWMVPRLRYNETVCGWDFPGGPVVKNPPASAGDTGSIPGAGRLHTRKSDSNLIKPSHSKEDLVQAKIITLIKKKFGSGISLFSTDLLQSQTPTFPSVLYCFPVSASAFSASFSKLPRFHILLFYTFCDFLGNSKLMAREGTHSVVCFVSPGDFLELQLQSSTPEFVF